MQDDLNSPMHGGSPKGSLMNKVEHVLFIRTIGQSSLLLNGHTADQDSKRWRAVLSIKTILNTTK